MAWLGGGREPVGLRPPSQATGAANTALPEDQQMPEEYFDLDPQLWEDVPEAEGVGKL
eukprot:COSAG01_NODE_4038_length_5412_cov_5.119706_1_plen_57_part_10